MFITDEEFQKLDRAILDAALERVFNQAIEKTLCLLPEIITSLVVRTKGMQGIMKDFRDKYPKLAEKEREFAEAVYEIELADGSLSLQEILPLAASKIGLEEQVLAGQQLKSVEEVEREVNANGYL